MLDFLFPAPPAGRASLALLALRLVAGLGMFLHGIPKMQAPFGWMGPDAPIPGIFQALAAISECLGGLALLIGLLTPLAAFGVTATMAVAALTHLQKGDPFVRLYGEGGEPLGPFPGFLARVGGEGGSWESAMLYLAPAIALMLLGAGRYSLDEILRRRFVR